MVESNKMRLNCEYNLFKLWNEESEVKYLKKKKK